MHMAWTQEQRRQYDALRYLLDTCDPYLEPLSNTQPWYDSISTGNVKEDKHIIQIDTFPVYRVFDFLVAYYGEDITISDRSSRRSGYLPEQNENGQVMLIIPYRGRFGAGWIVATHYTNTTVNCKYCLLADGGLNHGTD